MFEFLIIMANPSEIFINYSKPSKSSEAFWYVSEGLLSSLHQAKTSKNLNLHVFDDSRRSLLHYASYLNLDAMVLYLVLSGIDLYSADSNRQTAFHTLFAKGSFKAFSTLLSYEIHNLRKELFE